MNFLPPAPALASGLYLVRLAWDVSLETCLVTIPQGSKENNLGIVTDTEEDPLCGPLEYTCPGMKRALGPFLAGVRPRVTWEGIIHEMISPCSPLDSCPVVCVLICLLWGFQKREGLLHSSHISEELTTTTE